MRFFVRRDSAGGWRWLIRDSENKVVAASESTHEHLRDCAAEIDCVKSHVGGRHEPMHAGSRGGLTELDAVDVLRRYAAGEAQHTIAASYGVNQGRISEIVNGKRFPRAREIALLGVS